MTKVEEFVVIEMGDNSVLLSSAPSQLASYTGSRAKCGKRPGDTWQVSWMRKFTQQVAVGNG